MSTTAARLGCVPAPAGSPKCPRSSSDLGVSRRPATASALRLRRAHPPRRAYNDLAAAVVEQSDLAGAHLFAAHRIAPSRFAEYPQMHLNLAGALVDAARYDEAVAHYGAGLRYEPSRDDTLGRMVHLMQRTCDWRGVHWTWPARAHRSARPRRRRRAIGRNRSKPRCRSTHATTSRWRSPTQRRFGRRRRRHQVGRRRRAVAAAAAARRR